jgi:putrescine transport system ATP-binding protein
VLTLEGLAKSFGAHRAVDNVSLTIGEGELFALLGPSGCGKTTLLRMIGGFETPDVGSVRLDGADITQVPPHRRPVNMMFQSYALFPHMTVAGNVGFGLQQEGIAKAAIRERVEELLALVQLDGLGGRKPDQLSGGQRQRVALARALAKRPKLLLLDEPLSALDRKLREETRAELIGLQRRLGISFVLVTHDQEEALALADRIAVMLHGRVAQLGPPAEVYAHPANRAVAEFLGGINLLEAVATRDGVRVPVLDVDVAIRHAAPDGSAVWLAIRPERMQLGEGPIAATVEGVSFLGDRWSVELRAGSIRLTAVTLSAHPPAAKGTQVRLGWPEGAATVLTT